MAISSNRETLARIQMLGAIARARSGPVMPPAQRVMDALWEAIETARTQLLELDLLGQGGSSRYRETHVRLVKWEAAWRSNR